MQCMPFIPAVAPPSTATLDAWCFAFVEGPSSVHFAIGAVPSLVSILPLDDKIVSPRADVEAAEPGAPELVGFDFVLPREGIFSFNTQVCLMYVGSSGDDQLMCRPLNT